MKKTLFKPIGFGAAAGALAAGLLGQRHEAARLVFAMVLLNLASLGAPEALRRCTGRLTVRRQVRANAWIAAGMSLLGAAILFALSPWLTNRFDCIEKIFPVYSWTLPELRCWIAAALALSLVRILTVCFFAADDATSALLTEGLTFAAVGGSLLMFRNTSNGSRACAAACLFVLAITALIGLIFRKMDARRAQPSPLRSFALLRDVPTALARTLLYPALVSGLFLLRNAPQSAKLLSILPDALVPDGMSIPLLFGNTLLECIRTDYRRDAAESAPFRAWTTLCALAMVGGLTAYAFLLPNSAAVLDVRLSKRLASARIMQLTLASFFSMLLLYARLTPRTVAQLLLILAAAVTPILIPEFSTDLLRLAHAASAILVFAAALFALPDWIERHRRRKFHKMRAKANQSARISLQ